MRKYKSLLFREYKLSRDHYLFRLIILILFLGVVFLTILLNRDELQEIKNSLSVFMSLIYAMIAGFVCADDDGVYKSDRNTGWHTYSYCLPISLFEKTLVHYIVKGVSILVGAGMTVLGCEIVAALTGAKADWKMMIVFLFMVDLYLLIQMVIHAIFLVPKDIKTSKTLQTIVVIVILAVIIFVPNWIPADVFDLPVDELGVALPNMLIDKVMVWIDTYGWLVIPVLIVLLITDFVITYKTYERRKV